MTTIVSLKNKNINEVVSKFQKALENEAQVRLDSDSSLFTVRDLTTISTNVLEKKYPNAKYNYLPQLLETKNKGDKSIILPIYDQTGGYTVSDDLQENTKDVGISKGEQIVKVKVIQNHAKWSVDELANASKNRINLSSEKLMKSRNQWEIANHKACYTGLYDENKVKVSEGLFDYFYHADARFKMTEFPGIGNSGSGSTKDKYLFKNKTASVVVEEMLKFLRYAYESTDIDDYATTHCLIPLGLKTQLETTAWSTGSDRNILEYLTAMTGVVFQDLSELNSVSQLTNDTTWDSAMIAYRGSNEYIAHVTTEAYNLSAPYVTPWHTRIETKGKVVGGVVREGKSVVFAKGIFKV